MSAKVIVGGTYYNKGFFNQTKEMGWLPIKEDFSNISITIHCQGPNTNSTIPAEIRYRGNNGNGNWINNNHKARIFAMPQRQLINWFKENIAQDEEINFSKIDAENYTITLKDTIPSRVKITPAENKPTEVMKEVEEEEWVKTDDWFWEGNIQKVMAKHLNDTGFVNVKEIDTSSKTQGPDITAEKDGVKWVLEVKGYPSDKYVQDTENYKKGDQKKTNPATQARHWFSEALMSVLLTKSENTSTEIGLVFPRNDVYLNYLNRISYVRGSLTIHSFIIDKNGAVQGYHPFQRVA